MSFDHRPPLISQRLIIDVCLDLGVPFSWFGQGTLLICGVGASGVVARLQSLGERVIGLEGFELESLAIHPRLDLIYDSSMSVRADAASVASEWGDDVWVDVTLAPGPRDFPHP